VSFRYAAIKPKRGSSGAWGTASVEKLVGVDCDMCADILFSLEFGEEEEEELFEEEGGEEEDDGEGLLVLFVGEPLLAVLAVEAGDMLLGILSGRRCRRGGTRTRTREIWGESWELGLTGRESSGVYI
jgi:hypothetical protein